LSLPFFASFCPLLFKIRRISVFFYWLRPTAAPIVVQLVIVC